MCKHGTKTTPAFLPADGKATWLLLPIRSSYYQLAQCKRKHLLPYPQGDRSGLRKPKKGQASTLITDNTSIHLPTPVSTDLTIKPDSVLINPAGKDGV